MVDYLKMSELDEISSVSNGDLFDVSKDNLDTTYTSKKITFSNVASSIISSHVDPSFAKLDGTNQPFTGNLLINKTTPQLAINDTTNNYEAIFKRTNTNVTHSAEVLAAGASNALLFDSTSDKVELATPNSLFTGTGDFTISAWVYPIGLNPGYIAGNYGSGTGANGVEFYLSGVGNIRCYITSSAAISTSTYNINQWNFVAVTRTSGVVRFYINGVYESSAGTFSGNISSALNWTVGNGPNYTTERFQGRIQQVSVYNAALSQARLDAIYNSGAGTINTDTTNALLIWEMNEGTGTSIADSSGNSRTGTAISTSWVTGKVTVSGTVGEIEYLEIENGQLNNSSSRIKLGNDTSDNIYNAQKHTFNIANSTKATISETGNLLVGTTTDSYKLTVGSPLDISTAQTVMGVLNPAGSHGIFRVVTQNNGSNQVRTGIHITSPHSAQDAAYFAAHTSQDALNAGYIFFGVNGDSSTDNATGVTGNKAFFSFASSGTGVQPTNFTIRSNSGDLLDITSAGLTTLTPRTTTTKGLIIRGVASYNTNYYETQNSASSILNRIDSAGDFYLNNGSTALSVWRIDTRGSNNNTIFGSVSNNSVVIYVGNGEAWRFSSASGTPLLKGKTSLTKNNSAIDLFTTDANYGFNSEISSGTTTYFPFLSLQRSNRSGGAKIAVVNGCVLGRIEFEGYDSTAYGLGAYIETVATGTWSGSSYPTKLSIFTTPTSSITPLERITILESGNVGISQTSPAYKLDVTGEINASTGYRVGGTAGLSGTYNFDATTSGNITSMTFSGGILTAVTTLP